jgi:hypothetical protein
MMETAPQSRRLWALFLIPAIAWAVHLIVSYSLHATVCEKNTRMLLYPVSIVLILPALVIGWRTFHARTAYPEPGSRTQFLLLGAFLFACLFGLLIVAQTIPMVVLRPCD